MGKDDLIFQKNDYHNGDWELTTNHRLSDLENDDESHSIKPNTTLTFTSEEDIKLLRDEDWMRRKQYISSKRDQISRTNNNWHNSLIQEIAKMIVKAEEGKMIRLPRKRNRPRSIVMQDRDVEIY